MVVEFPVFSKVTLDDKLFFDEFNAQYIPYADWAFGTLMAWWNAFDDLEASKLGKNLVIKSSYLTMGKHPRFTLLGNHDIDQAIETIFAYQKQHDLPQELYSSPQYTLDVIQHPEKYIIVDDIDVAEYISSIDSHIKMEGGGLYHMRKAVHRFERAMTDHVVDITHVPLHDIQAKMLLINGLHTWHGSMYQNDRDLLEGAVIDHSLLIAEHIGLESLCIFVDKQLVSFVLFKRLNNAYVNINHIKVSREYNDLFRFTTHTIAVYLHKQGYTYINGEQDLGIEGLRRYKASLQPVTQFHKYNIYPLS